MGLFDEDYVCAQRIFLAHHNHELVAFLTLHESRAERALDLICHAKSAPAGTMQLLLTQAIDAAARDGCDWLSLAAVPCVSDGLRLPKWLAGRVETATGAKGLKRFKSGFAPRWQPLYLAAPSAPALALAGVDLIDRITRPRGDPRSGS